MQSIKLLSIKYFLIFCSAPFLYKTPGNSTIAAVPSADNHERICIKKAKSAFDLGARTPAGENLSSFINKGLESPSHETE
jgi:hypothetical protein